MLQRIVKWSPVETDQYGWHSPHRAEEWLATDLDASHVESFTISLENLQAVPELEEALTHDGKVGTIREMTHEVRQGQRIFVFLVDFED